MPGAVVLFSGGLDSTTLLWSLHQRSEPNLKALLFDYGQRHVVELAYGVKICQEFGIDHDVVDLSAINPFISMGSQSGLEQVPEGHYADDSMKKTVVPNRNMIMLSIAVGHAITTGRTRVYYAAHAGDHTIYPDCRPEFVRPLKEAIEAGNAWSDVSLVAPFLHISKADIVKLGDSIKAPYFMTWSCYQGGRLHCGKCGTCVERREAFQLAGVEDPTLYQP